MRRISKSTFFCLLVLVFGMASSAGAVSFSADMVSTQDGRTETGKFYLSGPYYRLEMVEDGRKVVVIVNREKKIHQVLNMAEKAFFELPSDSFKVLSKDPFRLCQYLLSKYESRDEGMEKINGIDCKKQVIPSQKYALWFSEELQFVLRTAGYEDGKERYATELKAVKQEKLPMALFKPPAGFKTAEDPELAAKRKRDAERKKEEAVPGLTGMGKDRVPCRVKIAAGGELRVAVDTRRTVDLLVTNAIDGPSAFTVAEYKDGRLKEGGAAEPFTLGGKGRYKRWKGNDDFWQNTPSRLADEIRITVNKGVVYAYVRQKGPDRNDFYNQGGYQTDGDVDSKRSLTVRITGDNSSGKQTTGKFWLIYETGGRSETVHFTVSTGKTKTWDYPADKAVKRVAVQIRPGQGQARISLIQPPGKAGRGKI